MASALGRVTDRARYGLQGLSRRSQSRATPRRGARRERRWAQYRRSASHHRWCRIGEDQYARPPCRPLDCEWRRSQPHLANDFLAPRSRRNGAQSRAHNRCCSWWRNYPHAKSHFMVRHVPRGGGTALRSVRDFLSMMRISPAETSPVTHPETWGLLPLAVRSLPSMAPVFRHPLKSLIPRRLSLTKLSKKPHLCRALAPGRTWPSRHAMQVSTTMSAAAPTRCGMLRVPLCATLGTSTRELVVNIDA